MSSKTGGEGMIYGPRSADGTAAMPFKVRVPLGMFELCREEIDTLFCLSSSPALLLHQPRMPAISSVV